MATTGTVSCQATGRVPAPAERVFARVFDTARFPELFRGFGPVPGVSFIVVEDEGATRRVVLHDGNDVLERIREVVPGERIVYEASGFATPLRWWCDSAEGEWRFQPREGETDVTWSYRFNASGVFGAWAIRLGIAPFFQLAMADCIRQLTVACETLRHQ
ncbi:SRPBCC family protein [Ectothiorhodospiraceae bacterium WFHF3C12]|nr:SRPBCC family protein [Ectothiorhodospiraceae bacterium WFHF3C12]